MKKLLLTGICLISCIQLDASEKEMKEMALSPAECIRDQIAICGGACVGLCISGCGIACGAVVQELRCKSILPQNICVDKAYLHECVKNGNWTSAGTVIGCAIGGAAALYTLYKCCFQDMRPARRRNHDD